MAPALFLALALLASSAPPPPPEGEPLPADAPTDDYALTAWCYGALGEYLDIYARVKPDLIDIDRMFGSSVKNESEPYASDIAAMRIELAVFAGAIEAAEKASPQPIAPQGAQAMKLGQSIWLPAESKTRRELARAWLSWGLPDRCDTTARSLATKSALLGQALTYNTGGGAKPAAPAPAQDNRPLVLKPIETPRAPPPAQTATIPSVEPTPSAEAPAPAAPLSEPGLRGSQTAQAPPAQAAPESPPPMAAETAPPAAALPQPAPSPAPSPAAPVEQSAAAPSTSPPPATPPSDQAAEPIL